jgi:putative ABC transport system permease protein
VDYGFFEAMGMTMAAGRPFDPNRPTDAREAFVLNEEAVRQMGLSNPVGKWFSAGRNQKGVIIGVVKNAHFRTFRFTEDPRVFTLTNMKSPGGLLMVKIDPARERETLDFIRGVCREIDPVTPFEFRYLEETYDRLYRPERQSNAIFSWFSGLAIFIAGLGLLGLASCTAERRTKEIGIRRVLGASKRSIVFLIGGSLTVWILASNIIAWPAAYWAANAWLRVYTFRTPLGWAVFVLPSLIAFVLAWLLVGFQSWKAARSNPSRSLRIE